LPRLSGEEKVPLDRDEPDPLVTVEQALIDAAFAAALCRRRPRSRQAVDLCHQRPIGRPCGVKFLGALLEPLAQVRHGLLEVHDAP
jgi:hypothetical protein